MKVVIDIDEDANILIVKDFPILKKAISEGKKITFCKDCKYWSTRYCCLHPHMAVSRDAGDFCSRGEM